jgi:hypothetical protein
MGHPPPIIACGREQRPPDGFEGLTPVHVSMVVQARVACDAEVSDTWAAILEAVQNIAPAGPEAFHGVAMHTRAVRVTTSLLACAMVDRPMVIVGLGAMVEAVCLGAERRPDAHRRGDHGVHGRGAPMFQPFQRDVRRGCVLVCLVAAWHQAPDGWTTQRGGGATAQLQPAWSGGACAACDFTGQPLAARPLVARVRFHWVRQWAWRLQMVRLVEATIAHLDPPRRGPLLEIGGGGNVGGVQRQWPPAHDPSPVEGTPLALFADRPGPVRDHGPRLAHAYSAVPTVEALQSGVTPFVWRHRIAATAWTGNALGPAQLSQIISRVPVILPVGSPVFPVVAPLGGEQPPDTDTARGKRF